MTRWAAFRGQFHKGPIPVLFLVSLAAYATSVLTSFGGTVVALCGRAELHAAWGYLMAVPWAWGFGALVNDWVLMIIAMMTPLVSLQVARIAWCSRRRLYLVTTAAFMVAYWLMWCMTIVLLVPIAFAVSSVFENGLAFVVPLVMALIYSSSPVAQQARNRCHRADPIPAFGILMFTKSFSSGVRTGANCFAACWPWMLVPLTVQSYHLMAMMAVGFYLFAERIAPAARPIWRLAPGLETIIGSNRPFSRLNAAIYPQGRRPLL